MAQNWSRIFTKQKQGKDDGGGTPPKALKSVKLQCHQPHRAVALGGGGNCISADQCPQM